MRGEKCEQEPKPIVETPHPMSGQIVRATGVCCRCDSHFHEELVLAVVDTRVPSGVVFIELRHLAGDPDGCRRGSREPRHGFPGSTHTRASA
jgi:hypothetical protein